MQQITEESLRRAADQLIRAHDGDVALLYLYYTFTGNREPEQAARELCRTLREIEAAEEKLRRMNLLDADGPAPQPAAPQNPAPLPPAPAEELPQYTAEEISRMAGEDGPFAAILAEAAKVLGRGLNSNEMRVMLGVYNHLGLPAEVVLELLNYCAEFYLERYGTQRRPTARAIEKEAYEWANREILTLEQAEAYIRSRKERRGVLSRVKAALDIRDRDFTASERSYVNTWLDMGFGEEAIAIAYERTVANTGSRKFHYMDRILLNWNERGLHEAKEIEEKDSRRAPRRGEGAPAAQVSTKDLDKALDKI